MPSLIILCVHRQQIVWIIFIFQDLIDRFNLTHNSFYILVHLLLKYFFFNLQVQLTRNVQYVEKITRVNLARTSIK